MGMKKKGEGEGGGCEAFCETGSRSAISYITPPTMPDAARDVLICRVVTSGLLPAMAQFLNTAAAYGSEKSTGGHMDPTFNPNFLVAAEMNKFPPMLANFGTSAPTVQKDQLVTAQWWNALKAGILGAQLASDACDSCNVEEEEPEPE